MKLPISYGGPQDQARDKAAEEALSIINIEN